MSSENREQKSLVISEKTLIPISLLMIIAGVIVAFTTLSNVSSATETRLSRFIEFQGKRNDVLEKIDRRLSRIEGKMGIPDLKE